MGWSRIKAGFVLVAGLLISMQPVLGSAKVFVVASTLDMADFTRQVGGQRNSKRGDPFFALPAPSPTDRPAEGAKDVLQDGGLFDRPGHNKLDDPSPPFKGGLRC